MLGMRGNIDGFPASSFPSLASAHSARCLVSDVLCRIARTSMEVVTKSSTCMTGRKGWKNEETERKGGKYTGKLVVHDRDIADCTNIAYMVGLNTAT